MNADYSESDTSDEDYNPNKEKRDIVSEEESNDDSEAVHSDNEENLTKKGRKKGKTKSARKRVKKDSDDEEKNTVETETPKPEDEKKRVDALWADFMKDTGFKSRSEILKNEPKISKDSEQQVKKKVKKEEKIKITQVFDFAGEEVKVEKEIQANSVETKDLMSGTSSTSTNSGKKPRGGGLSSVLSQIGKKNKISTLDKTKLDWDQYKKEANIEDELKAYGKSKDGYLERQDFLQRADLRRFEIEKSARNSLRTNRINNGT